MTVEEIRRNSGGEVGNFDNFPVGMRVLAVDDDPICLKLLDGLLRKCQYHVTTTSQAKVALKMLRENRDRFDLVISDVHMPDMDGFKLLEHVGLEMDLPVIMLSANSDTKLVMKGITHGACDYLVKPIRIEELRNIWQHVIRRKKFDVKPEDKGYEEEKSNQGSGGQGQKPSSNSDQNVKLNKKRKDEEDESEEDGQENEDPATQKKPRVVWAIDLHRKFVAAVNQLGIEKAVPKRILDLMNVEGLTRENVASHLQKYRLYLKRISAANQQGNIVAALGGKDCAYVRMGSFDGLGDFRTMNGPGRLAHSTLPSYVQGSMLGRLNSPTGVSLRNFTSSGGLIQTNHAQNSNHSISTLGKLHSVVPPMNQNGSIFQGMPASLELDQFPQNKCTMGLGNFDSVDDSRILTNGSAFPDARTPVGTLNNSIQSIPSNSIILQESTQELTRGQLENESSFNMASFSSESFNIGISGSSNLLDNGRASQNWQSTSQLSNFQSSSLPLAEPFIHNQAPQYGIRENNSHIGPQSQNSLDFSSPTSAVFEDSREELQRQAGLVGTISQNCIANQRWGDHNPDYYRGSNGAFGGLSSQIPSSGNMAAQGHMIDQNRMFNKNINMSVGRSNGDASALLQHGDTEKSIFSSRRSNEDQLLPTMKTQVGFAAHGYDAMDDLMSAIKREQDGGGLDGEFGSDNFPWSGPFE